jgi:general secretion pathway protein D
MGKVARTIIHITAICAIGIVPACTKREPAQRPPAQMTPLADPAQMTPLADDDGSRVSPVKNKMTAAVKPDGLRHIVKGSGKFLNPIPRQALAYQGRDGGITLNFVNAEITEVARAVLGGILKHNFAVDSAVKGLITLQTSRPIARDAVLPALENALSLGGAAIIPGPDVYRVVPRAKAMLQGAPTSISGDGPALKAGFAIRIVPLKFVSAAEMEKILTPLAFKGTIVRVDAARNLLIFAAPAPEIRALEDMVTVFDVDWLAGLSLAMIPLEFVNPEVLVKEITEVLGKDNDNPLKGVLRFVPMSRLNAVLVISPQAAYLKRAEEIITKLDQGGNGTDLQLFVYRVQNSNATEIADTLGSLFSSGSKAPGDLRSALAPQLSPSAVRIKSDPQSPTMTPSQSGTGTRGAIGSKAGQRTGGVRKSSSTPSSGITIDGAGQIRVVADKANNAILVWSTPADYRMVLSVLRKLDQIPLQVLIEATIAEVTLNETLRYGVQWFFRQGNSSFTFNSGSTSPIATTIPGFSYFLKAPDVTAIFDALESVTDLNVISSPQLMVLDNQTAELQVGDQVPVLTQQVTGVDNPNTVITSSVEYRDSGIILRVTPRVNAGGLVSMSIEQEASLIAQTAEPTLTPTIQQRRITSTVAVQSGETVVLGGLIQDTRDNKESGIPLLRDIPALGFFFGGKKNDKKRTELLVLITPRAVRNQREVRKVTDDIRKRLRAIIPLDMKIR